MACGKISRADTMGKHPSWPDFDREEGFGGRRCSERCLARMGGDTLKRLVNNCQSLALICWVYLGSTWSFWRWRLNLWRHPEQLMENTQKNMKQTLLFIRHGQTTWNVEHILPGQLLGIPLTATGREQAERLAEALKILPITALISSPLERASDTAGYLARALNLPVWLEDDLKDTNIGRWAGKNYHELHKEDPAWAEYVRNPTSAPEGIETFPQVQQRAVAAVERWLKREETGNYPAFVAHADVVKLLLAYYMDLETSRAGWLYIENASVSIVELEPEQRPRVVSIGWSSRPGWLTPPVSVPAKAQEAESAGEPQAEQKAAEEAQAGRSDEEPPVL